MSRRPRTPGRAAALGLAAVGAAVGVALAGCQTVGPDYRGPPAKAMINQAAASGPFVSAADNPAFSPAPPPGAWWRLYDDPVLDRLVQQAFAANDDLKAAEANLGAARAALEAARNGRYPQTGIDLGARYGRDAVTDEILELTGRKPQTVWLYDDVFDMSYELDLFGRVRRSIEASHADAEAALAARDGVRITIAAETIRAYVQACALGEEIAVARRSLDVVSREDEITVRRRDVGAGTEFDVVRSQTVVAEARAAIPPLEGQRRSALFQLAAILGRTPAGVPQEAEACTVPPRLTSPLPAGDGAGLLRRRPDVRLAERRLAAATARIGVATADLFPRITLTGLYGGAATTPNDLIHEAGLTWGVGPDISWNFPNIVGTRARIRAAKAGAEASLAGFDGAVLQALKETEQSLAAYSAELQHRQALGEAQDRAQKAMDMAHGQFLAGSASTLDLLGSERALVAANAAVAASDAAVAQDQVSVFKALGGGWRRASVATAQ